MSAKPPILYSGPPIDAEVPPSVRRHLQLIYEKLGNHTQAFALIKGQVVTTQKIVIGGNGGGGGGGGVPDVDYYQTVEQAGTFQPQESILNFLAPITVTDNPGVSSDVAVPDMVGDTGTGGVDGLVPAPGAGDAPTKFLRADATWAVPPGAGSMVVASTPFITPNAGAFTQAHGLGYSPKFAALSVSSDGTSLLGIVGWQDGLRWDATNFYLYASDSGIKGFVDSIK